MFERLLIALRLKKPKTKPALPRIEPLMPRPRNTTRGHVPPRPMPPPAPRVQQFAAASTPAPADTSTTDMMNMLLLRQMLNSGDTSAPQQCSREQEAEPLRAGGGGDFGGAGASGSWEPPPPAPSYEPPAPSPSYDSGSSYSSDSGSSSSYSSD